MTGPDDPLQKPFYRIGEVAIILQESAPTVRYWVQQFGVQIERSKKGQRVFGRVAIVKLLAIKDLLRNWRFTIEGAKAQLSGKKATC